MSADLSISRLIKAPPAAVWRAWAEAEHFDKWWLPHPMECRSVKHDLRPGGGFETLMREAGRRVAAAPGRLLPRSGAGAAAGLHHPAQPRAGARSSPGWR